MCWTRRARKSTGRWSRLTQRDARTIYADRRRILAGVQHSSRSSFEEISTFYQQVLRVKDKDYFPVVMVANKCDLEGERQVSTAGTLAQLTDRGL